ncbi:CinA family protein [Arcobacter arenosus]|uniref:CinA family protein n=1 Tax=Arcobacter arenosus TaxID=2576037 RepID=A0A5R8Y497_9BACT|nr:CinA family protein [Arcobacter arenosus]TLP40944.1 CinA family protein [Arcobacter arenosus]
MQESQFMTQKELLLLQNLLRENKKTITTAESCTGGLVASMITEISGSSDIFNGAIVSYSNKIKSQELNVKESTLDEHGAVSIEVVDEMLEGVIKKFDANYAIAISGIAGPNGGTKNKPVGTVVIGVCDENLEKNIEICHFEGSRKEVQIQSAKYSLKKILKFFQKTLDK